MTIGQFAKAGNVTVETVRYYQRRGLLSVPKTQKTGYRQYSTNLLQQLRFIKRAQTAGFTLAEIKELLQLNPVQHRLRIQDIARIRLDKLTGEIAELQKIAMALHHLIHHCEQTEQGQSCPIIQTLANI